MNTLKQMTEELFRYSVISSTCNTLDYEALILNHILEESISAHYATLKANQITPTIQIPEKKVIRKLDKNALNRILANIINNAIKYSDGDLYITLTEDGEFIFSNHASQLDKVQAEKLFNRFYTVETGKNSTGLGLSIAKILVEQMNGTITAQYQTQVISIIVSL